MYVDWVNHASFVLRCGATSIICDPWLEGSIFKGGWSLISPTAFDYADFAGVSHIWISHQHPDHFSPTNLRKIDSETKKRIVVLYQETDDKLVVSWLRSRGFANVRELPLRRWIPVADGIEILCGTIADDSWLAIRTPDRTFLNVNDCVLKTRDRIEPIASAVGKVDVFFTQFSYAQWTGNPEERGRRRVEALEKIERIRLQAQILQPETIVPCASYFYFCHEENFFLNDGVNQVADVARFIERDLGKRAVVLYPGDRWDLSANPPDWHAAAERYAEDFRECIARGPAYHTRSLRAEDVLPQIEAFFKRLQRKNPRARGLITGRTTVYITDNSQAYEISGQGIRPVRASRNEADITTSFESLLYAFKTPWGGNALHVTGRFTSSPPSGHLRFFRVMRALQHYNVTPVDLEWLRAQVRRVVRGAGNRARRLVHAQVHSTR